MNFKLIFKPIAIAVFVFGLGQCALAMEKEQQGPKDIFEAIGNRNLQAVTNFLDRGIPVDIRNDRGFTPLWKAIFRSDENLVRLLLQRGADVFAEVNGGSLIECAHDTKQSIQQLLLEEINRKDREVLRKAVLLHLGEDNLHAEATRNLVCSYGLPWKGTNRDLVESLLLKLRIYNTINEAVNSFPASNIKAIEWFLDNGDDINCKNKIGQTLLHHAISRSDLALFNICLQRGIDIDSQDFQGRTALHNAICFKDKQFVRLLVHHNARLDIKNWQNNKTPLDLAQSEGYEDILHIINAEVESQKQKKENSHFPQAFKRLITEGLLQCHPFVLDSNSAAVLASNDCMLANAFVLNRDKKPHCADSIRACKKPALDLQEPMLPVDRNPYRLRFAVFNFLNGWASLGEDINPN
jgi:ankyrin repeat protein